MIVLFIKLSLENKVRQKKSNRLSQKRKRLMLIFRPRPECETSLLLAFSVYYKKKGLRRADARKSRNGKPAVFLLHFSSVWFISVKLLRFRTIWVIGQQSWGREAQKRGNYLELIEVELT